MMRDVFSTSDKFGAEVIDLCQSSDEEDTKICEGNSDNTACSGCHPPSAKDLNKVSIDRKRPFREGPNWGPANKITLDSNSASELISTDNEEDESWRVRFLVTGEASSDNALDGCPLVILHGDRSENALVTDGIDECLRSLPPCERRLTCYDCGRDTSLSSSRGKRPFSAVRSSEEIKSPRPNTALKLLHIQQQDKWSCGFRNLQMLLAAIIPRLPRDHAYFDCSVIRSAINNIPSGGCYIVPSLRQCQQILEEMWKDGWDRKGADHFGHALVDRAAKVGAVEMATTLAYLGIDAVVVQFVRCAPSRQLLGSFVHSYFCQAWKKLNQHRKSEDVALDLLRQCEEGVETNLIGDQDERFNDSVVFPLYLQWEGHSVTIIGIEKQTAPSSQITVGATAWANYQLLVLDPSKSGEMILGAVRNNRLAPIRLSCHKLVQKDCQLILCASSRSLPWYEKQAMKSSALAVTAAEAAVIEGLKRRQSSHRY